MADPNRSQSESEHDIAIQLARAAERLESLIETVRELVRKVGEQNGRVGRLEAERAAIQSRSVDIARTEASLEGKLETILKQCECKMGDMGDRVVDLEAFRNQRDGAKIPERLDDHEDRIKATEGFVKEAGGAFRASLGVVEKIAMILTLILAAWRIAGDRGQVVAHTHEPAPVVQHQGLK